MSVVCFPTSIPAVSTATVVRWLKLPGDEVVAGDALVELETESGLLVIEAVEAGKVVGHRVKPGQTLSAGAELAEMAEVANVRQPESDTGAQLALESFPQTPLTGIRHRWLL